MRIICTLLLIVAGFSVTAQTYNNEWINHNQTYYKFKIGKNGLYRIPQSALAMAGVNTTQVEILELYRNGARVPFYPSVPSGALPGDGYVEFWGQANDGAPDNPLYRDPRYQHTKKLSLFTDSAAYFLTVGTVPNNLKIEDAANDVQNNTQPAEPYFMHTAGTYFKNRINPGYASVLPEYVYLSSYDKGEFFSTGEIAPGANFTTAVNNLFVYNAGPASTFNFGLSGNANNPRSIRARVNNTVVKDTLMDYFNDINASIPISTSLITPASFNVVFNNLSAVTNDRMVVSYFELIYPRQFNFGNQTNFEFTLPPKPDNYYLEITNFNGGTAPVLYDLTNSKRYISNVAGSVHRFAIPGSIGERRLVLVSSNAANVTTIPVLTPRNFMNYANLGSSPDSLYLIVTNSLFFTGSSGNNPINDYKAYRESPAGGSNKVLVADISELTDQFAFGIKHHPASIRNFLRYARTNFNKPPRSIFIIGRGMTYSDYFSGSANPNRDRLNLVPTFGYPASDNLLSADNNNSPVALTPIGRLSVVHSKEIEDYLEKVKEYESAQQHAPATLASREWMKNVVHVTGSSEPHLGSVLCNYMGVYRQIIQDTLFGGKVSTFCKVSTNAVEQLTSDRLVELFAEGISLLTYFGHSSSTTLEFNIDNPSNYNNQGKYPVFCVNGCNAGNFFTNAPERLLANETLSEKFTLAKQRGGIAFIASTHLGLVNYLNLFINNLYTEIGLKDYGKSLGETNRDALADLFNATGGGDYYARMHAEQITLHGDPGIHINSQPKPDYVMEESLIKISPSFISVADNTFQLKIRIVNLGRAFADSIMVEVKRQFPEGGSDIIYHSKIPGVRYADSLTFNIPIVATRDKGLNKITVTLDTEFAVNEMSESNNTATKEFFIYDEEARPVIPYNFSIIGDPAVTFYATTANPFSLIREYTMEIDTTEAFNSPAKVSKTISSSGGLLEFNPGVAFRDSTVYYWRVATAPPPGSTVYQWNNASFTFINNQETGFGQDHYFQHLKSGNERIQLGANRQWTYVPRVNNMFIPNGVYPYSSPQQSAYTVALNQTPTMSAGCNFDELIINVVHPVTFKPWVNQFTGPGGTGLYNSDKSCGGGRQYNFMYSLASAARRKAAMDFLSIVPNGYYVVIRSNTSPETPAYPVKNTYPNVWKADTTLYGSGNSLYHTLFNAGFYDVESFNKPRAWSFVYKKGDFSYEPRSVFTDSTGDRANINTNVLTKDTIGYITSPKFGPAAQWHEVIWRGKSLENPSRDQVTVDVIGINNNNVETHLFTLDQNMQTFDVSAVDPVQFPFLRLHMRNADSIAQTPYQLDYWRVLYTSVPEGTLAPNLAFTAKDTLDVGEVFKFAIPFKNISKIPFDSLLVNLNVIDRNNVPHPIILPKQKPLVSGDTVMVRFELDTKNYLEHNTVHINVNPDFEQPEQYLFNNFVFRDFYVRPDNTNPLLDVTFDGVHIINRDIVSARPHVQIRLKDEAKFMLLNDTSISTVQIKYPDNTTRLYHFDNDTLRFTPAVSGADNSAVIDFFPAFTAQINPEGDEYELSIKANDKSGNRAGTMEYRIAFRVISKPMISNLLNYPNPFSTSTAFVFTLTGSELPQNMKVQILTITGKIVREITMNELGPIHIGRNITEFKWNGTDQYGQKLGNGVYLYRVVTTMNGKSMDKYKADGDNTDKFFNNGYGKMYLMR